MENNFDSQKFRDKLSERVVAVPKEKRRELLEEAKEKPAYWQARGEKIHQGQKEEIIDNGLGVFVKKKTLYHGSGTSGIKQFNKADEDTVGSGIYFTSEAKDAIGYARRRSYHREGASPVIYEASVVNTKLLDLRKDENVKKVLDGFKPVLEEKLRKSDLKWYQQTALQRTIEAINSGKVGAGNLKDVTFSTCQMFSDYCKSLGYDGLVTFEGGEGDDIGHHDTYLIFNPEKAKINQEHQIS